jgi:hypothetical protein
VKADYVDRFNRGSFATFHTRNRWSSWFIGQNREGEAIPEIARDAETYTEPRANK